MCVKIHHPFRHIIYGRKQTGCTGIGVGENAVFKTNAVLSLVRISPVLFNLGIVVMKMSFGHAKWFENNRIGKLTECLSTHFMDNFRQHRKATVRIAVFITRLKI
jgi:hypothetical protein